MNHYTVPTITKIPFGSVEIPSSKSITNRALILSLLANTKFENNISQISNFNSSRDTELMINGIEKLGAQISRNENTLNILAPKQITGGKINVGLSGTVLRFLTPISILTENENIFFGDNQMKNRPIESLLKGLSSIGGTINNYSLPFSIKGPHQIEKKIISINSSESSQFISGLLFLGSRVKGDFVVKSESENIPSRPFIDLTVSMLLKQGAKIEIDKNIWLIKTNLLHPLDIRLEPDLTNSAVFCAAAAITKGMVEIRNWPINTKQPGDKIREILKKMGIDNEIVPNNSITGNLKIYPNNGYKGIEIDLSDYAELTPTITALALFANSPTIIKNVSHIKGHETNRLKALVKEITNLNGNCYTDGNNLTILPQKLSAGIWKTYHDHRLATTGALVGLKVPNLIIENIDTVSKTFPNFLKIWKEYLKI